MIRLQAPAGVTSVSFGGETVNVVDGHLEVDPIHQAAAIRIGCKLPEETAE